MRSQSSPVLSNKQKIQLELIAVDSDLQLLAVRYPAASRWVDKIRIALAHYFPA